MAVPLFSITSIVISKCAGLLRVKSIHNWEPFMRSICSYLALLKLTYTTEIISTLKYDDNNLTKLFTHHLLKMTCMHKWTVTNSKHSWKKCSHMQR